MPGTQYFGGNSLSEFNRSSTAVIEFTSVPASFDATYVNCSLGVQGGSTEYAETTLFSATGTLHWMFEVFQNSATPSGAGPTLFNGATGIFRLLNTGTVTNIQPQYWNGSAWTNTGSAFNYTNNALARIYVKVVLGSSFECYLNGALVSSGSGWSGGGSTVTKARMYPWAGNSGTDTWFSQVMLADYDVRDSHVYVLPVNGDSATNNGQASGTYADVDEIITNDADAVVITTVGARAGFTKTAITTPSGFDITAMIVGARARVVGGGMTDLYLGVRSGGTNYPSTGRGYPSSYGAGISIVKNDPATGLPFTQSGFNSAEVYVETA